MTTSMNTLPPRPDLGPPQVVVIPPQRRRVWPIVAAIAGGLVVLGVAGTVIQDKVETTPSTVTPIESTTLTVTEAAQQSAPLAQEAADEMGYITQTSAISQDIIHLNSIADLYERVAVIWDGVDDVEAMYMHSAADHFRSAALTWPDDAALHHIELATDDLNSANDALPS